MSREQATVLHKNWTASPSTTGRQAHHGGALGPMLSQFAGLSLASKGPLPPASTITSPRPQTAGGSGPIEEVRMGCAELAGEREQFYISRRCDSQKGWEQYGRVLARRFDTGWEEYWQFLDCL